MTAVPAADDRREVRRALFAVYTVFIGSGFGFATWAGRIPQVRDSLHVDPAKLGLILLFVAAGSIVSIPLSGTIIALIGEARTIALVSTILAAGLIVVGIGSRIGIAPVCAGLWLVGFGNGAWDVSMNVQGATVERRLGKSVMSRFHAGFSIGTVAGAGVGAIMVALHVPVVAHLIAAGVLIIVVVPATALRGFLPHVVEPKAASSARTALTAWREPRTLLIGLFVLCMAFTEGTGNDWLGIATIDGYHMSTTLGVVTLDLFLAAMTVGRWFGPGLLDRHGRVFVLRTCALMALAGLLLVVFGSLYLVEILGVVLWGLGASLGFPTGMSAAADDPRHAAARVSAAASIAYLAFLGGPPVIGFVANHLGVLHGLTVAAALLAVAVAVCGACAPLQVPADEPAESVTR